MPRRFFNHLFMAKSHRLTHIAALSLMLASISAIADTDADTSAACQFDLQTGLWQCSNTDTHTELLRYDWLNAEQLSPSQQQALGPGCTGTYVDPLGNIMQDQPDMSHLPLVIEADSTEVFAANNANLQGDVRVSQGTRSIGAEEMAYSRLNDSARLSGDVTIRQPGVLLYGSSAEVSTVAETAEFKDAEIILHNQHMRGSASSIKQKGRGRVVLTNGAITSCAPDSKAWSLEGQELAIDQESGQGYGRNVKLRIADVPVFYLPYMTFPVGDQRRSGFLFPNISSSDKGGLDISVPYYLNLAPNYDATITPRIISDRGAMLEAEFRHLSRSFEHEVSGSFLPDDDGSITSSSTGNGHIGDDRWLFQLQQDGGRGAGWYSQINYNQVSDEDYFRDLGTSSFEVANTTYLDQQAEAGTQLDNWNINLRVQDYQTLLLDLDAPYRKLPQMTANGNYNLNQVNVYLGNQYTYFDHSEGTRLDGRPIITGERFATDYRVSQRFGNAAGFFKPEVGYKHLYYQLTPGDGDSMINDTVSLGAAHASIDTGLVLEHQGGRFLQTLEPRAFYLYRQYQDQSQLYNTTTSGEGVNFDTSTRTLSYGQLFRDSRFSGADRLDDADQLTLGLTNRWISHHDGHEFLALSLGQTNHFREQRIGLESEITAEQNTSEWALEFTANGRKGSGLYGGLIYDEEAQKTSRFSTGYNYVSKNQLSLFNISYSYVRQNPEVSDSEQLDQVDAAFVAPLTRQWYLMGRSNYDFENSQELESFAGIEYNDCCYRFRLLARRWLDSNTANSIDRQNQYDQGIFFEVQLKGLGSSGSSVYSLLDDAIPGYRRREQQLSKH